jgi:hypothetical protein
VRGAGYQVNHGARDQLGTALDDRAQERWALFAVDEEGRTRILRTSLSMKAIGSGLSIARPRSLCSPGPELCWLQEVVVRAWAP